ncbi:isoprenylcysteine carboxylmethyltransferase family protein [Citricoccus sp.]|uniref:methyltransferase family protein n=1 Tax=Citricoccus sp. TaxID=1978372 RepID=UPI002611B039|nr:isoprenylcysteine carboxylmethyltransferase family protein [Citricoccus sp.]HRO29612.1 isoprenylcysteine carboxylmethyltransferase family protein [Citricoccus sp.]HRO93570.1 isoprenylcysteine carboxylmethyltransferase family protein [Citricoccus sp.]
MENPRIPPPLLALSAAALQRILPAGATAGPLRRAAAQTVATASAVTMIGASAQFLVYRTTVDPREPERASTLVTSGPNVVTRNPMYLGMAGLLAAHAIRRGRWAAWVPVAAFVMLMDRTQIPAEERALRERFGAAYEDYCAAVPRWLDRRSAARLQEGAVTEVRRPAGELPGRQDAG